MSTIVKINKPIVLKYEDREIKLPDELKEKIEAFWENAIKENPNLYNGIDYAVEKIIETDEKIEMIITKSNYAHYLYDERVGIEEEKYRCCAPAGGILILTKDDYFAVGEMSGTTSVPYCLQIPGGGFDILDIEDGIVNLNSNIKRELKEELNLNLDEIDYKIEYIEYPNKKRNACCFLAIGRINKTKDELSEHFEEYKKYLMNNNLEIEFNSIKFFKKENALQELDGMPNNKRPYLRDLIKEAMNY